MSTPTHYGRNRAGDPQLGSQRGPEPASYRLWDWFIPNATVFVASGCIMTVEILSTRLAARFLGSSLYTWTSAIGVVLAGISLGNYLGGRLADRYHPRRTLAVLFILASVACLTIPLANNLFGRWGALNALSWPTRIFLHFVLAFLLPATTLGTMGPVVAKMALSMGQATGRTIGTIYAWGAIGSIVGTFVAGFFLVAWVGSEGAVLLVAGVLALVGIGYGYRSWVPYAWTAACIGAMVCALGPWSATRVVASALGLRDRGEPEIVFRKDSQYQQVVVQTAVGRPNDRKMVLDKLLHSSVDLADPLTLKYEYEQIYAEVTRMCHPLGRPLSAFMIGGGGYVFPRYLELTDPGCRVEVAEIDPVVTEAAHAAFGLPRDTTVQVVGLDARNHVADLIRRRALGEPSPTFDFIYGDSFSDFSVPYHLTTVEFTRQLAELLSSDGVYMLNLIDVLESGQFLGAVVNTCRQVFCHVYVFSAGAAPDQRNTFVVVCAHRPLDLGSAVDALRSGYRFVGGLLPAAQVEQVTERTGHMVLTDDYAPVENLLTGVVRRYKVVQDQATDRIEETIRLIDKSQFAEAMARCRDLLRRDAQTPRAHFYLGVALARQGKLPEAVAEYQAELALDPAHIMSYVNIGLAAVQLGDPEGAVAAYRAALRIDPVDAAVRCNLAAVLAQLGRTDEALAECREAVRIRPGFAKARHSLGVVLLQQGDAAAAAIEFAEALKFEPDYPQGRYGLATALLRSGRAAEALTHLRSVVQSEPDNAAAHNLIGQALAETGDLPGAVASFREAVRLEPGNADFHLNLGLARQKSRQPAEAAVEYRECLRLQPNNPPVLNALAWLLATSTDDQVRNGTEAVRLADQLVQLAGQDSAEIVDTLAAAYAEAGRFDEALQTARRALDLAEKAAQPDLVNQIQDRLKLYGAGRPYRE